MENQNAVIVLSVILALIIGALVGAVAFSTEKEVVVTNSVVELVNVTVPVFDNSTNDKLNVLLKDENFETVAEKLAIEDLEDRDYKDLYKAMDKKGIKIDEKEDINSVVIKEIEVKNIDADDGDANVELELKVYFENLKGNDVKIYLTVKSEIIDGEVETVKYKF